MLRFHRWVFFTGLLAIVGSVSCARFQAKPVALYPSPARSDDQVATLSASVDKVDGVEVTKKGALFTLLPGCHIVLLKTTYSEGSPDGLWSATIPKTIYALRMKAGYDYEIDIRRVVGTSGLGIVTVVGNSGASGSLKVTATERDKNRAVISTLSPVAGDADIAACRTWEQEEFSASPSPGGAEGVGGEGGGDQ